MSDVTKKTIERLKKFSEAIESNRGDIGCANCGPLLPGKTVVLVGLRFLCKPCFEREQRKLADELAAWDEDSDEMIGDL